jgi:hypothetical protein
VARRGRGAATTRADLAPDGMDDATNGADQPGARTMGAIALQRWAARDGGHRSEEPDAGDRSPTHGPFDEDDVDPARVAPELVDFGAVRVPVPRGGQVGVEPEEGRLQAVHVMLPAGRLSVSALAAPRTERLWPDLAAEIDESLREGGATVRSFTGEWGRELHARTGEASSVFVGVDGPRWMLYGVATGPTSSAKELDAALRRMLRGTVVVRGRLPYPVRTVLPLTVPGELAGDGDDTSATVVSDRVPAARSAEPPGRNVRAGRPGATTGSPAPTPPRVPLVADGAGAAVDVPTAPHGLPRPVPGPGGNGHPPRTAAAAGPPVNGSRPPADARAVGAEPARRGGDGLPDAPADGASVRPSPPVRDEPPVTGTGQRRVAELLAQAERDRAAREARARAGQAPSGPPRAVDRARAVPPTAFPAGRGAPESGLSAGPRPTAPRTGTDVPGPHGGAWRSDPYTGTSDRPAPGGRPEVAGTDPRVPSGPPVHPARPAPDDRWADPWAEQSQGGHDEVALLRLGGAPRPRDLGPPAVEPPAVPGWSAETSDTVHAPASARRVEPVGDRRPVDPPSDGSEDWTVPMSIVRPADPAPEPSSGRRAHRRPDLWADDPWAEEARRAARAARAAEQPYPASGRDVPGYGIPGREVPGYGVPGHGAAGRKVPRHGVPEREAPERGSHERGSHERPAHRRAAHEKPFRDAPNGRRHAADRDADVPVAPVAPPVTGPPAHLADEWADPFDGRSSGRHRRPER